MEKVNKAIKFFEEEIVRLRKAPEINGCEMTPEWIEQLQIYNTALEALRSCTAPKTNFDRIKNMSVEEIAEAIHRNDDLDVAVPYCKCFPECDAMMDVGEAIPKSLCVNCIKRWLESEATQ